VTPTSRSPFINHRRSEALQYLRDSHSVKRLKMKYSKKLEISDKLSRFLTRLNDEGPSFEVYLPA